MNCTKRSLIAAMLIWVFSISAHANCLGPKISEDEVKKLPGKVVVGELLKKFGEGCLAGMTAMTVQYQADAFKSGRSIWFWLSNEPEPATKMMQTNKGLTIGVLMAVAFDRASPEIKTVIWPLSFVGRTEDEIMEEAYFAKYRKK
jgi:hypothetical protein